MTRASKLSHVTLSPAAVRRLYPQTSEVTRTVLGRRVVRQVRNLAEVLSLPAWMHAPANAALASKRLVWIVDDAESSNHLALLITRRKVQ